MRLSPKSTPKPEDRRHASARPRALPRFSHPVDGFRANHRPTNRNLTTTERSDTRGAQRRGNFTEKHRSTPPPSRRPEVDVHLINAWWTRTPVPRSRRSPTASSLPLGSVPICDISGPKTHVAPRPQQPAPIRQLTRDQSTSSQRPATSNQRPATTFTPYCLGRDFPTLTRSPPATLVAPCNVW